MDVLFKGCLGTDIPSAEESYIITYVGIVSSNT